MTHIFDPKQFKKLESPERYKLLPPEDIRDLLSVKDLVVADVGCGIGYFSFPFAEMATKVMAIDISPIMIDEVIKRNRFDNVLPLLGDFKSHLTGASIDLFFTATVIHEIEDLKDFTQAAIQTLKPGGRIAYLDFKKIPLEMGPPLEKKIAASRVVSLFESLRLKSSQVFDIANTFYMVVATK